MNNRPTPETDAAEMPIDRVDAVKNRCFIVTADFARRLERERDEAREELEQAKQDAKQHEVDCLRALHERNEARAEGQEQARLLGMSAERELKLIRERDEAREELLGIKTLQLNENDLICACGRHQPCRHC